MFHFEHIDKDDRDIHSRFHQDLYRDRDDEIHNTIFTIHSKFHQDLYRDRDDEIHNTIFTIQTNVTNENKTMKNLFITMKNANQIRFQIMFFIRIVQ